MKVLWFPIKHDKLNTHFSLSPKQKHSKKITKHFLWPSWELHLIISPLQLFPSSPGTKNLPAMQEPQETWVPSLGQEDPLEKGLETHSIILAWRIPCTEEPGGLQSIGSQRVRQDWSNLPRLICTEAFQCVSVLYWQLLGIRLWTLHFYYFKHFSNLSRCVLLPSFSRWEHQVSENLNDLLDALTWSARAWIWI